MSTDQLRSIVSAVYDAEKWRRRVARMDDYRVFALYKSLQKQGKVK